MAAKKAKAKASKSRAAAKPAVSKKASKAAKPEVKKSPAPAPAPAPASSSAILAELAKAAKAGSQKKGEADGAYIERICASLSEATEKDASLFDKLSKEAQKYYDSVADAVNADKAPPLPPDAKPEKPEKPEKSAEPAKKSNKDGGSTKGNGEDSRREPRKDSIAYKVRMVVVDNPAISFEDAAKKAGFKAEAGGHVWNIFNHAKCVMEMAGERYSQVGAKLK